VTALALNVPYALTKSGRSGHDLLAVIVLAVIVLAVIVLAVIVLAVIVLAVIVLAVIVLRVTVVPVIALAVQRLSPVPASYQSRGPKRGSSSRSLPPVPRGRCPGQRAPADLKTATPATASTSRMTMIGPNVWIRQIARPMRQIARQMNRRTIKCASPPPPPPPSAW
jgi:hypothetical protein